MQQNSTLKKLAEVLHLSVSTVSRALKNHPDISAETKKRVKELAVALDYEPNSFAISLRNNTSNVLGILVPSVDNFFYDSFIAAVEQEARLHQYSVLIMQSGESMEVETANLKLLKNNRIAGIFVSITTETNHIQPFLKLQELNIPILFFDRVPDYGACNKICVADKAAAKIAAEALIAKQKKHVLALFGHLNLTISKKRLDAFRETYELKSPGTKLSIGIPLNVAESKNITLNALESNDRPDAIFCMGDLILIGAMQAIHEKGIKIPDDISVITISNGFIPTLYNPKITFVETSGYKLGKLAFKRMMSCLSGNTFLQELTLDSVLVEGGSL
jgi:LacI family transcriptional regulator